MWWRNTKPNANSYGYGYIYTTTNTHATEQARTERSPYSITAPDAVRE